MTQYYIEPRTRKCVKGHGFLLFARKYRKQLLVTGLDTVKNASKTVVHTAAGANGEIMEKKLLTKL